MSRQNNKERKVQKFRISLLDDESHKQIWALRFNEITLTVTIITVVVVVSALFYSLIAFTPIRTTIPGYPDAHTKREAIQNAIKIDSLENIINRWELYSDNLNRIVRGEQPLNIDSLLIEQSNVKTADLDEAALASKDSILRASVNEESKFNISDNQERQLPIEGVHFFTPLKGVISQGFDRVTHPYVDITAPVGSVVMSVLDGTVIFAGWNDEAGYTIQIQHSGDIISVYKHNQKLLKKQGDKVSAGSSIALVGNTGSLTSGAHLHFELWHAGEAMDPAQYINF